MEYRQTSCSLDAASRNWLGGCKTMGSPTSSYPTYHNTTSPAPLQGNGYHNGGGYCDCGYGLSGSVITGSKWLSAFDGGEEWWQNVGGVNVPSDMLQVQTYTSGSNIGIGGCSLKPYGFKNVSAKRQWHGCYGWNSNDACDKSASIAADQVRFTTATCNGVFTWYIDQPSSNKQSRYSTCYGSVEVGQNTGVISSSLTTTQHDEIYDYTTSTNYLMKDVINGSGSYRYNTYDDFISASYGIPSDFDITVNADVHCYGSPVVPYIGSTYPYIHVNDMIGITNEYISINSSSATTVTFMDTSSNVNSYSSNGYVRIDYDGGHQFRSVSLTFTRTLTNYYCNLTFDEEFFDTTSLLLKDYWSFVYTGSLSSDNSASVIEQDCETLLGQWDLGNDIVYPWRQDTYIAWMPLVTRRERQTSVQPFIAFNPLVIDYTSPIYSASVIVDYNRRPWFDDTANWWRWDAGASTSLALSLESSHFDGTVIGQPLQFNSTGSSSISSSITSPVALGWGWFDFYYDDERYCQYNPSCTPPWQQYKYGNGGTLADAIISIPNLAVGQQLSNILPMCSTHWTNNLEAHSIPKGASVCCNINGGNYITATKYAETRLQPTPSYNHFRPCGADRVLIDETTAQPFITTGILLLNGPITIGPSDLLLVGQRPGDNGIYSGSNVDGSNILTLGTKIADLPTDYYHPLSYTYGFAGIIRFPNAWSICGREGIVTAASGSNPTSGSIITFNNPQTNLRTNDNISLYDVNMSSSASGLVYRVSDTQFTMSNAFVGSITASKYVQSSGSPDYHWNDTTQKYQYRTNNFFTSLRSGSFDNSGSCNTDCLYYTPCSPQTVYISPNTETFPASSSKQYWFTTSSFTQLDGVYGSYYSYVVEFSIPDALWQRPMVPYGDGSVVAVLPDDGTCPNDYTNYIGTLIMYYPPIPLVEAMCNTASASPTLPAGVTWPEMYPPSIPGVIGYSYEINNQPWSIYSNEQDICQDTSSVCRFKPFYNC